MARPKKVEIDRESLVDMYVTKTMSTDEIAKQIGVSQTTICNYLRGAGVDVRAAVRRSPIDITADELRRMYCEDNLNMHDIAARLGCTYSTVRNRIVDAGIEIRYFPRDARTVQLPEDELRHLVTGGHSDGAIGTMFGVSAATIRKYRRRFDIDRPVRERREIENRYVTPDYAPQQKLRMSKEELVRLYCEDGLSQAEIANRYGVSQVTVANMMVRHGISSRGAHGQKSILLEESALRELYIDRAKTMGEIATQYGCSETTIRHNLVRYGITADADERLKRQLARNKDRYSRNIVHRGYTLIRVPNHAAADKNGYVAEHRLVAETAIGRQLEPGEIVHHINLRCRDNRETNLAVLRDNKAHLLVHRYTERVGVYLCHLTDIRPEAIDFGAPVFWGGKWITSIDLIDEGNKRDIAAASADYDNGFDFESVRAGGIAEQRIAVN